MSELHLRLTDLRRAAENLRRSAQRIDGSTGEAAAAMDGLLPHLSTAPDLLSRYTQTRAAMQDWSRQLTDFADKLEAAADDIAAADRGTFTLPPLRLSDRLPREVGAVTVGAAAMAAVSRSNALYDDFIPDEGVYVAERNQALYARYTSIRGELADERSRVSELVNERRAAAEDLAALKNRLHSYDPLANPQAVPRVQQLEAELTRLDGQISDGQQHIGVLSEQLALSEERLLRVLPAPGADLDAIRALEGAQSPAWLRDNTFDCVRHVVERVPVPPALATDAHEWLANAAALPQYGMTSGEVPLVGSVLVVQPDHPYADDVFGHLFYVERVEGSAVWVTDNFHPETPVRLDAITGITSGPTMRYLYLPWHTQG